MVRNDISPLVLAVLVLIQVVAARVESEANAPYYCNVKDAPCENSGTCNFTSSLCTCPQDYSGYDCGINNTLPSCPAANCSSNGVCSREGSAISCHCEPGYYGSRCQYGRISVDCFGGFMVMNVYPHGTPANMFIVGFRDSCTFSALAPSPLLGKQFNLTYATDCGQNYIFNFTKVGVLYYGYRLVVEVAYIAHTRSILDYVIEFSCKYPADGQELAVAERAGISNIELNIAPTAGNQTFEVDPIDMVVKAGDGVSELTVFRVGVEASLVITLDTVRGYSDMQLMTLTADDGMSMYNLILVENGCLTSNAMPIYVSMVKIVTNDRITFVFTLFKFTSTANVNFVAQMKGCTKPCSALSCSPSGFPATTVVGRRRKRGVVAKRSVVDAEDLDFYLEEGTKVYSMGATLKVTGFDLPEPATPGKKGAPGIDLGGGRSVTDPIRTCLRSWPYIVTVVAFSLLLCVAASVAWVQRTRIGTMRRHHFVKLKFGVPTEYKD